MFLLPRRRAALSGGGERPVLVGFYGFCNSSTAATTYTIPYDGSLIGGISASISDGDLIVVGAAATSAGGQYTVSIANGAYTAFSYAANSITTDDNYDISFSVGYRVATAADGDIKLTFANIGSPVGGARGFLVSVWRGVDQSTPMDVSPVTASGLNTGQPDPGAITPSTANSEVLVFAAAASTPASAPSVLTTSSFTGTDIKAEDGTSGASIGFAFGYYDWASGAFDCPQFGGGSTSTASSWAAATLALRPAA